MASDETDLNRFQRYLGLAALLAMIGGFALSFSGTVSETTILTWLGYPEYDLPAFLLGLGGFFALLGLAYWKSRQER